MKAKIKQKAIYKVARKKKVIAKASNILKGVKYKINVAKVYLVAKSNRIANS